MQILYTHKHTHPHTRFPCPCVKGKMKEDFNLCACQTEYAVASLSGACVIPIKVIQPAANDNHWPWKDSWDQAQCVCECVWKRCRLVFVCTSMPSLDQRCAWLYRHSSPLMTGTRQSGKALWRHRRVGSSGSSSQDDRKAMALINGLSLVSQAFDNHYSTASCVLNQSQQPWKGQQSRVTLAEKCWKDCHQESRRLTGSVAGFHFFFWKSSFYSHDVARPCLLLECMLVFLLFLQGNYWIKF